MAARPMAANNFLLPNWTFVVEVIVFVVIVFVLGRFVVPRLQQVLGERRTMVAKQVEDAEQARTRLVEAERAYQDALADARAEAAQIREDARAEVQRSIDALRVQAQEESARIVARGEEQLAGQRDVIMRELRAEVGTLAIELSEKITDQRLADQAEVSATVDSFLAGLAAEDHARGRTNA